jgi:hypothetical protein
VSPVVVIASHVQAGSTEQPWLLSIVFHRSWRLTLVGFGSHPNQGSRCDGHGLKAPPTIGYPWSQRATVCHGQKVGDDGIQRLTMWWSRGGLGTAATYIEVQGRETARLRPQCLDWGCPAGQRQSGGSVAVWKYIIYLYKWIILLPFGYLHSHGKSSLLIGTSSINWSFSIAMLNNQRVMILLHPITTYQMIMVIKWLSWLALYPVDPCDTRMQIPILPQTLGIWRGPRGPTRLGVFFLIFLSI